MADPEGPVLDEGRALSIEDHDALAKWAEHEPSDDFADAVMAAWQQELDDDAEAEAPAAIPRRATGDRNLIGLVVGVAAAAAVLLLVIQPTPKAEAGTRIAQPDRCAHALSESAPGCDHDVAPERTVSGVPDAPVDASTFTRLSADALAVVTHHCMPCHDGRDDEAKAGALEVYDVRQPRWWRTMSDEQLEQTELRVRELGVASEDERRSVAAFVDAELTRRARAG